MAGRRCTVGFLLRSQREKGEVGRRGDSGGGQREEEERRARVSKISWCGLKGGGGSM
jgi:hypothetical protein